MHISISNPKVERVEEYPKTDSRSAFVSVLIHDHSFSTLYLSFKTRQDLETFTADIQRRLDQLGLEEELSQAHNGHQSPVTGCEYCFRSRWSLDVPEAPKNVPGGE
jgi:hypothetical protein